ncbi:MAG: hypothetical protein DRG78_01170 [Epsilonproteobacteria bacterium]|nr:MAG: hypothetical protein DRG78_01170 [Campylobacterota bacterium]
MRLKQLFRYSLILTIPISAFFIIWLYKTISIYSHFQLNIGNLTTAKEYKLQKVGKVIFYEMFYSLKPSKNIKTDVQIFINKSDINSLNEDLPYSGFKYKKALVVIDGVSYKSKVRYRGDNAYHWIFDNKSWRVKTSKKKLYDKVRKFNLINPKFDGLMQNLLSYELAKTMGILAPEARLVDLSVNGEYKGIKLLVEQIDENFLRNNRRMPNDIYKGDNIGTSIYRGVDNNLFNGIYTWEKNSYNNHYNKNNKAPLQDLLYKNKIHEIDNKTLYELAKFSVFLSIANSYHSDNRHNWIVYYDNYHEAVYPIVWDTIGFDTFNTYNLNIMSSSFLKECFKDYRFIEYRTHIFNNFFKNKKDIFLEKLEKQRIRTESLLSKINYYNTNISHNLLNFDNLLKKVSTLFNNINIHINKIEDRFYTSMIKSTYYLNNNSININLNSFTNTIKAYVSEIEINKIKDKKVFLEYKEFNKLIKKDITSFVSFEKDYIKIDLLLITDISIVGNNLKSGNKEYKIIIEDFDVSNMKRLEMNYFNVPIKLSKYSSNVEIKYSYNNIYNLFDIPKNNLKDIIWNQKIKKSNFTLIKDNIIIKAGTKIILDKNATIKFLGKVTAIGTKENPIIFEAKDSINPWGAIAVKDKNANGSIFKHCIFKNGSGSKGSMHEYTAMLSIHNVKDIVIENCEFYDSKITDDMVHVIYSDIKFKNTKFVRSHSDALDIDISNATIDNCEFVDSGNDAIDLMTTNAIVTNTKFTNSIDKAISIGEGSKLLAVNNYIENNEIGMQSKDTSIAYIYNTTFIKNKKAIDAYYKNWRYGEGGTIILDNCKLENNILNATVGKKSKVIINNSDIDTLNKFDNKSIRKKKIIISNGALIKYDLKEDIFKNKQNLINKQRRGYSE